MPKIASAKVHRHAPAHFNPEVHVAGCFLIVKDKFLILLRHPNKPQGETWGIPSGKLKKGESPLHALIREVEEEIGLHLNPKKVIETATLHVEHTDLHFCYHLFYIILPKKPDINLNLHEHTDYKWVSRKEASKLDLIGGGQDSIDYFFNLKLPLEEAFELAANPLKANWYKNYMCDQFPYLGVAQPVRKKIQKTLFRKHPIISSNDLKQIILELWKAPEREYLYTAIDLLKAYKNLWDKDFFLLIKKLLLSKSWWDSVDSLATQILGPFLLQFPEFYAEVEKWKQEDNLWLKRALILTHALMSHIRR